MYVQMWLLHFLSVSWLHCHYAAVTTDSNYRLALICIWYAVPQGLHKCKRFGISGLEEHKWLLTMYLPIAMLLLPPGKWGFSMKFCWPKKGHCFRVYYLLTDYLLAQFLNLKLHGRDHREWSVTSLACPFDSACAKISVLVQFLVQGWKKFVQ